MTNARTAWRRLGHLLEADAGVLRHTVWVSVWGRWLIWLAACGMLARRPDLWYPDQVEFLYLAGLLAAVNGFVHYRLLRNRPVTWHWMVALGVVDLALITANVAANAAATGSPDNLVFIAYYPALAIVAVVFYSLRLVLAWATAAAAVYTFVSVTAEPGVDLEAGRENVLLSRVFVMYLVVVGVSLIARFERARRQALLARERALQQERIELSQTIHDTAAQTAYLINAGLERAAELAGDSNPQLTERLAATAALSRSAMWELRGPIDMGRLFEGRGLGRVLGAHTATFARVAAVPAELVQSGEEPPLPREVRSGLFAIAHNALANALLHARASRVEVGLSFEAGGVHLSVSDDGVGLPEDYAERGRGFGGMEAQAERMGGRLVVESGGSGGGTTITCVVARGQCAGEGA
ncbi:MAG: hypothetical protein F4150_07070 [Chloroflexi bacterium]|nr:hypothetical protein [Chloroflexota bacterium]